MVPRQVAQEAPVLVTLHPGQRHVGGGLDVWDIQPQGDMRQCGTLDLHESDRVAQPQRQVGGPALLSAKEDLVIRVGEDGQHVAALRSDQHGIALNAKHRASHPVHKVLLLLQIASERDPHALVNGNLQGLAVHELAGVVVVADVALVVTRHTAKRGRVGLESLHGQVVQEGGAAASDGQEKGLRGLVEDVLYVQLGGFGTDAGPTIRHGPVPTEECAAAAPDPASQFEGAPASSASPGTCSAAWCADAARRIAANGGCCTRECCPCPEAVEVTQEDQGGPPVRVVPQPQQALDGLLGQLAHLVDDHHVKGRHAVPGLLLRKVEKEHAAQSVHVQARELDAVSTGQHPSGARDAHVRPSFRRSTDGHFHRALARTCRPQHAEGAGDLSACGAQLPDEILHGSPICILPGRRR